MTKELTAEQKLKDLFYEQFGFADYEITESHFQDILKWHKSECKRFALECVPAEAHTDCCLCVDGWDIGWNDCREQMIKNIDSKVG